MDSDKPTQPNQEPMPNPETYSQAANQAPQQSTEYNQESLQQNFDPSLPQDEATKVGALQWTASEYRVQQKNPLWFVIFIAIVAVISLGIFLLTHEKINAIVILVTGGAVAFFASQPPTDRHYEITEKSIKIDAKEYPLDAFQVFSVVDEGTRNSIWLRPIKKPSLMVIMHYPPEQEMNIINTLSQFLPHEDRKLDIVDRLAKKINL